MSIYTDLARQTVEQYLRDNSLPDAKAQAHELRTRQAGCFVSIHEKNNNNLRGCIGTFKPEYNNLAGEIIANAYEAAYRDPRFSPVSESELDNLKYSVDVLDEPELIDSHDFKKRLDPKKYGVIVRAPDGRTGLLLPNLPEVDTIEKQLSIAREKADISPAEPIDLFRFRSERYEENNELK